MGLIKTSKSTWIDPLLMLSAEKNKTISKKDYKIFCREFIFEKIKGKKFGVAFCEKFNILSTVVYLDDITAKKVIENKFVK